MKRAWIAPSSGFPQRLSWSYLWCSSFSTYFIFLNSSRQRLCLIYFSILIYSENWEWPRQCSVNYLMKESINRLCPRHCRGMQIDCLLTGTLLCAWDELAVSLFPLDSLHDLSVPRTVHKYFFLSFFLKAVCLLTFLLKEENDNMESNQTSPWCTPVSSVIK